MDLSQTAALLASTDLFGQLDEASIEALAARATQRKYPKGQLLFYQGDPAGSLFIMKEGLVKVFLTSEDGDEMLLVTLHPPETFGELALLDGSSRSASAQALEPTTVVELNRQVFLDVIQSNPTMTDALLRSMGGLLRRLTEQASDLVFLDLHGRVAKLLVTLSDARGVANDVGIELDLRLTQTDIASMVGGSRQSINQILKSFEERGYLSLQGKRVLLREPARLRKRAGL